jgi:hypothetical protein
MGAKANVPFVCWLLKIKCAMAKILKTSVGMCVAKMVFRSVSSYSEIFY